ncbi:hypothetical protein RCOM_0438600 [Ricinus communis]|uniref:Uncharacterized protein n=1 Tax=Ricinus communis TaxID=3988 RepID=B9T844_RICCO|nr:hypothetical protein RCOM_0438600 [Ricinus communis]
MIHRAFPYVASLTVYVRSRSTLQLLAPLWPTLHKVKLVRWHQRSPMPPGSDFAAFFEHDQSLVSVDLSNFHCWTEDLPPALKAYPTIAASL